MGWCLYVRDFIHKELSQLSKCDDVLLLNRQPAIKKKTVSTQAVKVERGDATTTATPSTSTATTKTTNPQIQTENKTTNENLLKIHSCKTKTLTKDIVKQNSTENIEGNENAEKEILNMSEKEDNKARTKNGYNCR